MVHLFEKVKEEDVVVGVEMMVADHDDEDDDVYQLCVWNENKKSKQKKKKDRQILSQKLHYVDHVLDHEIHIREVIDDDSDSEIDVHHENVEMMSLKKSNPQSNQLHVYHEKIDVQKRTILYLQTHLPSLSCIAEDMTMMRRRKSMVLSLVQKVMLDVVSPFHNWKTFDCIVHVKRKLVVFLDRVHNDMSVKQENEIVEKDVIHELHDREDNVHVHCDHHVDHANNVLLVLDSPRTNESSGYF
jgi:hypothetical protein